MAVSQPERVVGRRRLLRWGAALAGAAAARAATGAAGRTARAASVVDGQAWAMLVDITQCVGCRSCVFACQEENGWKGDPEGQQLDGERWTAVREVAVKGSEEPRFVRTECFHCLQPSCADACIVGALRKTAEGPVVYDAGKCIGCRYCMIACPFQVPRYQWDQTFPLVAKCDFCADRIAAGKQPACSEACPTGATLFGRRDELVEQARARLASEPDRYVQHIYGLEEAGGTSWLFITDVPFEQLGFARVGTTPPPQRTRAWMQRVPAIAVGIAGLLAAAHVIEGRGGNHA
ncbi:4Fe-4S dicluster domain-containing protein [Carboxydochorda subterranea]|uniref:4Fe-4S dicluster domain-containing protein n=1 Tax=Carboxydichorda subterranea TaxID=3109565 RepID=A0ABZ1C1A4_9FIRM|nr:4Fe-4S dicluster domain-containing protein [Limnochorda sp. L945t]WRP18880.1 4Fe-4S dicluster domain-containing protein [Limnochorda sp. L945t]